MSFVCRYNLTAFTFVVTSWGKYLLFCFSFCVIISMAIVSFVKRLCGNLILTNSIAFFYTLGLTSIVTLHILMHEGKFNVEFLTIIMIQ